MRLLFFCICYCLSSAIHAQAIATPLTTAIKKLEADMQFSNAIISMYVAESTTGKVVFSKNEQVGLAPASCQKVITSATAFELLGKNFSYKTFIGYDYGNADTAKNKGSLFIIGSGDPTLGSRRWKTTTEVVFFNYVTDVLIKNKCTNFLDNLVAQDFMYGADIIPDGWIWQDIGNYYGAGCYALNWKENEYNMVLQPGAKEGDAAQLLHTNPVLYNVTFNNTITTGKAGSGDNAYIYAAPFNNTIIASGTVPLQKNTFTIRGSMPYPAGTLATTLQAHLTRKGINFKNAAFGALEQSLKNLPFRLCTHILDSITSPPLDSINYWFLKTSVNLFGEAFVKTIGYKKNYNGSTANGINIIKDFWSNKGISNAALNIIDGSGLSPANRVTTKALVTVMQYARQRPWFTSFYAALPEINGIKMKDGYINGVRSYTGYITGKNNVTYTFSFIVNNFNGSPATVREKIWKVLDVMK
jgi:serine-type D-Ala-D-Ala carboxypeptidase/endopeptidase (penicillin-binding protein 4)